VSGAGDERETARGLLLGAWHVVAFEDRAHASEEWNQTYGPGASGVIIYDPSGIVSVQVPPSGSIVDYVAYFGTFRVTEAHNDGDAIRGVVNHHMEAASAPFLLAEEPPRAFEISGGRLTLGDQITARRILERRSRA
jgi:hypothetical protein